MSAWIDAGRGDRNAHPWFAEMVFALDAMLRQRQRVVEYTTNPACIFRVQLARAECEFDLADQTHIRQGDLMLNLHLWNEQIPPIPPTGATIAWARRFCRQFELSLCELARYCAAHRDLHNVAALSANVAQATRQQCAQLTNIMRRFGFEPASATTSTRSDAGLRRLGENILISAMVLAQNPVALRADSLRRDRTLLLLPRTTLFDRFGKDNDYVPARALSDPAWLTG